MEKVSKEAMDWATAEIERLGGPEGMAKLAGRSRPFSEFKEDILEYRRTGVIPERARKILEPGQKR